jgi:hypothetical protein
LSVGQLDKATFEIYFMFLFATFTLGPNNIINIAISSSLLAYLMVVGQFIEGALK